MKELERIPKSETRERLSKQSLIITIDGSTTAGKRLVAEKLAEQYNLTVLDTGTTIRAIALLAIEHKLVSTDNSNVTMIPADFTERVAVLLDSQPEKLIIAKPRNGEPTARVMLGERDLRAELLAYRKRKAIDNLSSVIAASPNMRERLYKLWRDGVKELGNGVVVIGRKTGVDLFPEAPIKLYLFASPKASAAYRIWHDPTATLHQNTEEQYVRERDGRDLARGLLEWPKDALVIDTSDYVAQAGTRGMELLASRITGHIDSKYAIG